MRTGAEEKCFFERKADSAAGEQQKGLAEVVSWVNSTAREL